MSRVNEKAEELREMRAALGEIEMDVVTNYTLADAIREGSTVTTQAHEWGDGANACAMTAAVVAARSRNYM
jgi:hypothetical protein